MDLLLLRIEPSEPLNYLNFSCGDTYFVIYRNIQPI